MWRNECPFAFPTMAAEVFAARALILREPAEKLTRFLDIPWCKADLFYIQKLLFIIEAHGEVVWQTYNRSLPLTTTSPVLPGSKLSQNQAN
jgi:hypothetical protein